MKLPFFALLLAGACCQTAHADALPVPPVSEQIATAVLPLPAPLREHATVVGYGADMKLTVLRTGTNGLVCTGQRPGNEEFDVRCYQESFIPLVRRIAQLGDLPEEERPVGAS